MRPFVGGLRKSLASTREGLARVATIVRDLLSLSTPASEERWPVDVQSVLESAVNIAMHTLRGRTRLVRRYGDVPPLKTDPPRLGQVLLNLLFNAAQSFQRHDEAANEVSLEIATQEPEQVAITIGDNGSGIPTRDLQRIFEPFFTTKPSGTGLGFSNLHRKPGHFAGRPPRRSRAPWVWVRDSRFACPHRLCPEGPLVRILSVAGVEGKESNVERAETWESARGRLMITHRARSVMLFTYGGHLTADVVPFVDASVDRLVKAGIRPTFFVDLEQVSGYDSEYRRAICGRPAAWSPASMGGVFLVRSRIVAMGVTLSSLRFRVSIKATTQRSDFDAAMQTALRRSA